MELLYRILRGIIPELKPRYANQSRGLTDRNLLHLSLSEMAIVNKRSTSLDSKRRRKQNTIKIQMAEYKAMIKTDSR